MKLKSLFAAVAAITIAFLAAACGGNDAEETQVEVSLAEFSFGTAVNEIRAGEVTFVVSNDGDRPHEFVIIKSDLPAGELPVVEGKVPEDEVNLIDEIEPFAGNVRIIACIEDPAVIRKILAHLDEKAATAVTAQLPPCRAPPAAGLFD